MSNSSHGPDSLDKSESTCDIVRITDPKTKAFVGFKVLVTLPDGKQFLSNELYETGEAALAQLQLHLKEVGCSASDIQVHKVQ